MDTTTKRISQRITGKGRGWVFTPKDFLDYGSRSSVDQAMSRMARKGKIRRLTRGIYEYPRVSSPFGVVPPDMKKVAEAVSRNSKITLQVSEAAAANALGLSTQLPTRRVYLTDGSSRTVKVGSKTITFRRATPRKLNGAGKVSGSVFQALNYFGPDGVDNDLLNKLSRSLSRNDKKVLSQDVRYAHDWMRPIVSKIVNR